MSKLLIVNTAGVQEVIEIGRGGAYFDLSKVLWDERIDGPLPELTIGGMVRIEAVPAVPETEFLPAVDAVPASLVFDQSVYDARVTAVQAPQVVTMAQAQKALVLAGIDLAAVDAAIAAIPDDTARALARFGRTGIVAPGGDEEAVRPLPVVALGLPEDARLALFRAGLKGSYFALITLAFAEVLRIVANSIKIGRAHV